MVRVLILGIILSAESKYPAKIKTDEYIGLLSVYIIYYFISSTLLIISLAIIFSARKPVGVRLTVFPSQFTKP